MYLINSTTDALARAESNDDSEFPNSLRESGLKLPIVDEGSFVPWLGQGDRYKLLPARKNNTWNAYDIPTWLYIYIKSSFISA